MLDISPGSMRRAGGRQSRNTSIRSSNIPLTAPPIAGPRCDLGCDWLPVGFAMEWGLVGLAAVPEVVEGSTVLGSMEVSILMMVSEGFERWETSDALGSLEESSALETFGVLRVSEVPPNDTKETPEVKAGSCWGATEDEKSVMAGKADVGVSVKAAVCGVAWIGCEGVETVLCI